VTRAQDAALAYVRARSRPGTVTETARLTINLHPDRVARDGRTVLEALADDGEVRNQFETGISAGGLDHIMGGARSRWERTMFGGAYDGASAYERPRYAGLTPVGDPWGACPRFGSCHLVLRPHVRERATYTWGDSVTEPTDVGVWGALGAVMAGAKRDRWAALDGRARVADDLLDGYVEAQVHAPVRLADDVERIVLDGAFRDTEIHGIARKLADRYDLDLGWAPTRALDPSGLDPTFRTPVSPGLAREVHARLARPGQGLDVELVGRAAQDVVRSGGRTWAAYGEPAQVLQELKYLWHHLVAFGTPA
jgi:Protein of unknown function (DUF3626)